MQTHSFFLRHDCVYLLLNLFCGKEKIYRVFLTWNAAVCSARLNSNWFYRSTPNCPNDLKSARIRFSVRLYMCACVCVHWLNEPKVTSIHTLLKMDAFNGHGVVRPMKSNECAPWTDECIQVFYRLQNKRHTIHPTACDRGELSH